ncbi:MAG: acyltransferase [Rhodoferax sp.]|nr:acyltransferase [Rhodoferax sp.]
MQPAGPPESTPIRPASVAEDPVIEALRGFAALMVVATHYAYMLSSQPKAWGFASTGVDLFFVLSGYVFAPYFFGRKLSVWPHLIRRFFRLYPLYVAALLLYVALKLPDGGAWRHFGVHLFMGHTLRSTEVAFYYNPAFWSLPVEVEYYLLLPLLVWLVARTAVSWFVVGLDGASHVAVGRGRAGRTCQQCTRHRPGACAGLVGRIPVWLGSPLGGRSLPWQGSGVVASVIGRVRPVARRMDLWEPDCPGFDACRGGVAVGQRQHWRGRRCRLCGCGQRSGVPGSVRPWRHPLAASC